jgi:DNA-binding response OmpR family regulator
MKVLVAEDDAHTREGLSEILSAEGYEVLVASDGHEALELFERESPDFVCLDVMMPGVDGYEVCKRIRSLNATVPIIFISAKSEEIDKVLGLELGGDDFIVKPFGVKEVIARIRAVSRRFLAAKGEGEAPASFEMGDLEVLPAELRARRGDQVFDLSLRDVKILQLLHANRGKALDRNAIFNHCWGMHYIPSSRTLDQHISQLRKRIEVDPKSPKIIRTVHGLGYRYDG